MGRFPVSSAILSFTYSENGKCCLDSFNDDCARFISHACAVGDQHQHYKCCILMCMCVLQALKQHMEASHSQLVFTFPEDHPDILPTIDVRCSKEHRSDDGSMQSLQQANAEHRKVFNQPRNEHSFPAFCVTMCAHRRTLA